MEIPKPVSRQPMPPHAKKVFSGVIFDVYQWEQKLFDGTTTTFEKLKRRDSVALFPVLENGDILLIEDEQPGRSAVLTGPGGQIDDGEDPLAAARRELKEETGYEADRFEHWFSVRPTSKIDWTIHTFIAKGCRKTSEPHPEAGEKITLRPVNFDSFLTLALHENFQNKEVTNLLLRAQLEPGKIERIRELFLN